MLDQFIVTFKEALSGIDRAYVIEQLGYAKDALPFDYQIAIGYAAVGIGVCSFAWFGFRFITEPKRAVNAHLLGSADKTFMSALTQAVAPYRVYPHVAVNSVITTRSLSRKRWRNASAKTAPLRYDYLICDDDMRIIAAVDYRHKRWFQARAVKRGLKAKRSASKQSGLPLVTFDRKFSHTPNAIRQHLMNSSVIPRPAATPSTRHDHDAGESLATNPILSIEPTLHNT